MAKHGKKYLEAKKIVESDKLYDLKDAVELAKKVSYAKFNASVEVHVQLGIDPKKSDQNVRSTVTLPHGTGKDVKVLVFAQGERAEKAKEAGADFVGAEDLVEKITKEGWTDFDVAIASSDMMRFVGKLGKVLGPKGLMPSPKAGTVTDDIEAAVKGFKAGRVEVRNDKTGNVHFPAGKVSFEDDQLVENIKNGLEQLSKLKPAASKGKFFQKVVIAPTMGPGIKLDINALSIV
ncbi:50S ribosomal protein L1 [Oceanotoga sp. DSM 15011]|jgi:large subunit ribosomal protein L1|uniref:Large ribosomal subunit protein uL1 n=1 Tax=Oceanotoga teriensis TaxID=515440 RepID=A0AA45C627_9BACT|nr:MULTISPECIES: 50S ribosomal protein L1 [Oceanotoga]PWJ90567.1 LSU ribosomal protein L1P [Oceanotoga teriensis]UYO99812.1 50S ribosomal protein L1 [Oceanotoga sp. DSM 15011]